MKPATVDEWHAARTPEDRAICDRLRSAIDAGLPEARSRIWHAHPVWFLGDNPVVGYGRLKTCVRLMFWSGQSFAPAPAGCRDLSPTGTFKAAEARYTDVAQIDDMALAHWLSEAREVQWDYANIVKRKGKLVRLK